MRWRRRSRRRILLRCRQYFKAINSLRLNCDFEIHRSQSWHNVLLFTHNVIHTNQTFQAAHCIVSMAWQSHSCCTKSTDLECLTKTKVPGVAKKCSEFFLYCSGLIGEPKAICYCCSFCTVKWPKNDPNSNWTKIGHKREMWNKTPYLRSVCTTKRVTQFWYRNLK